MGTRMPHSGRPYSLLPFRDRVFTSFHESTPSWLASASDLNSAKFAGVFLFHCHSGEVGATGTPPIVPEVTGGPLV